MSFTKNGGDARLASERLKEQWRKASAKRYERDKSAKIQSSTLQRKSRIVRKIEAIRLLKSAPCTDCCRSYPFYVMDFDHISDDKICNVSQMANHDYPMSRILAEIAKCELVCSNCHRHRTYIRRGVE
jgi:hypothetical protein